MATIDFSSIIFPVYYVKGITDLKQEGPRLYGEYKHKWLLIDDTSVTEARNTNLGIRRLLLVNIKANLYPLKKQVNLFRQVLKYPSRSVFIDSMGTIFMYKKGKVFGTVVSKRITRKFDSNNRMCIEVEGIPSPFILANNYSGDAYASILETTQGPLLYDITYNKHKPYRKKY